jgi:hypothetical protein
MRFDPCFLRCHVETRGAIHAIAVEQRHGRHIQVGAGRDQILRQRSPFEEAESRTGVKLDVHTSIQHSAFSTQLFSTQRIFNG